MLPKLPKCRQRPRRRFRRKSRPICWSNCASRPGQLAQHLLARQRETDVRESRINAQQSDAGKGDPLRAAVAAGAPSPSWPSRRTTWCAASASCRSGPAASPPPKNSWLTRAGKTSNPRNSKTSSSGSDAHQLDAVAARLKGQRSALKLAQRRWQAERRRQQQSLRLGRQSIAASRAAAGGPVPRPARGNRAAA